MSRAAADAVEVILPVQTVSEANRRDHWAVKAKRVNRRLWIDAEIAELIALYCSRSKPIDLAGLAKKLGRDKANVCRKARALGLTNQRRPRAEKIAPPKNKYKTIEDARKAIGLATARRIAENGHPRGALGMKHTVEAKEKMRAASVAAWRNPDSVLNSSEHRQRLSDHIHALQAAGKMRSGYSRSRGGKRDDLGDVYFRSAWEANYARYLNFLASRGDIASWEYEPKTFTFDKIKRGTRSYTPDFRVVFPCGRCEWHEVKGWMDQKSKTRLARFARYYPKENLVIVDSAWFKSANKTLPSLIPNWEKGTVRV